MSTRNFIIGLCIIAAVTFLLINPTPTVMNQRTNNATLADGSEFQSRLEAMVPDEQLTDKLASLETKTLREPLEGETREVKSGDRISVHYKGWLAIDSAQIFDQSFNRGQPFTFTVGQGVIQGWSEGAVGMKVGEVRRLKIPSSLGYQEFGSGDVIPPNADLLFDVELVKFN